MASIVDRIETSDVFVAAVLHGPREGAAAGEVGKAALALTALKQADTT